MFDSLNYAILTYVGIIKSSLNLLKTFEGVSVYFKWQSQFETGIKSIDDQHRVLVSIIGDLERAIHEKTSTKIIDHLLSRIVTYIATHFSHEEKWLLFTKYPDAESHKVEHEILKQQIFDFHSKVQTKMPDIDKNLLEFLKNWINDHIMKSDKKYVDHFIEKKVMNWPPIVVMA